MTKQLEFFDVPGLITDGSKPVFEKVCAHCRKPYRSNARRQKYCCVECNRKHQKLKTSQRREYAKKAESERLRVASHKLAVAILEEFGPVKACQWPGCDCTKVHAHHKNLQEYDNRPENLMWVCEEHHPVLHSAVEKAVKKTGLKKVELFATNEFMVELDLIYRELRLGNDPRSLYTN